MTDVTLTFDPSPTMAEFMLSDSIARFIVGPVGCLAADTEIITSQGPMRIDQLTGVELVLSWDESRSQFAYVPCGRAYPKGTDYLYRVVTQRGEFVAAGHHRVFCADGTYQQVQTLCAGDVLSSCEPPLQETTQGAGLISWPLDAQRLKQKAAGSLAHYAELARRCGQRLLQVTGSDPRSFPLLYDAQTLCRTPGLSVFWRMGGLVARSLRHIRHGLRAARQYMLDCLYQFVGLFDPPSSFLVNLTPAPTELQSFSSTQDGRQSLDTLVLRCTEQQVHYDYISAYQPCDNSISERSIISIEKLGTQEQYWDIQVPHTHNYVTVDGAIHHNSGKTYCCLYEMIRRMAQQEPGKDGFRRTRWAIVRQTLQQIKTSVLKDIELIFAPIMRYRVSENTIYISAGDIRAEILLIPLDTPEDQRRLLSTQLTGVFFNEFAQIDLELVVAAMGRLGRYPSPMMGGPTWHGLIADSNPGTTDNPWYDKLINNCPHNWDYYHQPPPIDEDGNFLPEAENIHNLVDEYYQNLLAGASPQWAERYIFGRWGESLSSQAVFLSSFIPDFHVADGEITPVMGNPVVIGMDMARHPAAVFGQMDAYGRLLVFHVEHRSNMGVEKFIREVIKPFVYSERMQGLPTLICGDPSGISRGQIGERSVFDMLKMEGFQAFPASTNLIPPRLRAVEGWLNQQRDGKAAVLFDPVHASDLIHAMRSGYRYRKRKTGELEDKPDKNHPDSDIADALQYLCLGISSPYMGRIMNPPQPGRPAPPKAAWT